jgi:hypothetical protein
MLGARMHHVRSRVVQLLSPVVEGDAYAIHHRNVRRMSVIPLEHLVLMKLETGRIKDEADIVELLKAGASSTKIARYLRTTWPELLPRFRPLVARAHAERKPSPCGLHKRN